MLSAERPAADALRLASDALERAFGASQKGIDADLVELAQRSDLTYRALLPAERDQVVLGILRKLDAGEFAKAGVERHRSWEQAWAERAEKYVGAAYANEGLMPNYMDASDIVRIDREFVRAHPCFETGFSNVFRRWLFRSLLRDATAIYELGCGSGVNLATLAELFPDKALYGLDWASSAVDLVNLIARRNGYKLQGRRFDFFAPDESLELAPGSAVVSLCALEQIGWNHDRLLQFLLARRPLVCVHMEPLCELYDEQNLVDYLALRYHRQRNYLQGFLTKLRELDSARRIQILRVHRPQIGNIYHEGYSYVVWRPL